MGQTQWPLDAVGPGAGYDLGGPLQHHVHMKVTSPASDCQVALETSDDGVGWSGRSVVNGPNWGYPRSDLTAQYVRPNVLNLGTGGHPLSVVITWGAAAVPVVAPE